jgi:hypothetical protein
MRYLKDYFLTDDFFVRGHVVTGNKRLSTFLNGTRREFIEVEDALCTRSNGEIIRTERAVLPLHGILLAHEAGDGGDEALRALAGAGVRSVAVTVHIGGPHGLQVQGKLRRSTLDREDLGPHRFIALTEPRLLGILGSLNPLVLFPGNLPYVIANRQRISLLHL